MIRRVWRGLGLTLVAGLGFVLAVAVGSAAEGAAANPWTHTMTAAGDGLVVTGGGDTANNSALLVEDHARQPIFSVLEAGGAAVLGDDFRVLAGNDVYHGQVTVSADDPNPAVCVRPGQLWIGGAEGRVWRCADLDGSGPSPLAWWWA